MAEEQLKERCKFWQQVLRLQDWRVEVRFASSGEMPGVAGGGSCEVHPDSRTAVIKVLRPDSYNQTSDFYEAFPEDFDLERTLIHELLHIPLDGLFEHTDDADEFKGRAQEQFIEQVTNALYEGYVDASAP